MAAGDKRAQLDRAHRLKDPLERNPVGKGADDGAGDWHGPPCCTQARVMHSFFLSSLAHDNGPASQAQKKANSNACFK